MKLEITIFEKPSSTGEIMRVTKGANCISLYANGKIEGGTLKVDDSPFEVFLADSQEDLNYALTQGWNEPYQYLANKWMLRRRRQYFSTLISNSNGYATTAMPDSTVDPAADK